MMQQVNVDLAQLKRVDLREVWGNEAISFTPWLANNIDLLGQTIGVCLEVQAQEKAVGMFRADILAKDTDTCEFVLIENQIERTDHSHLGQLITYASGLQAVTIVWIADQFAEEHRAAIDWLNEITSETVRFFGLEIELWQIANSPVAPKFNLVCKPNNWRKKIANQTNRIRTSNGEVGAKVYSFIERSSQEGRMPTVPEIRSATGCSQGTASTTRSKFLAEKAREERS